MVPKGCPGRRRSREHQYRKRSSESSFIRSDQIASNQKNGKERPQKSTWNQLGTVEECAMGGSWERYNSILTSRKQVMGQRECTCEHPELIPKSCHTVFYFRLAPGPRVFHPQRLPRDARLPRRTVLSSRVHLPLGALASSSPRPKVSFCQYRIYRYTRACWVQNFLITCTSIHV